MTPTQQRIVDRIRELHAEAGRYPHRLSIEESHGAILVSSTTARDTGTSVHATIGPRGGIKLTTDMLHLRSEYTGRAAHWNLTGPSSVIDPETRAETEEEYRALQHRVRTDMDRRERDASGTDGGDPAPAEPDDRGSPDAPAVRTVNRPDDPSVPTDTLGLSESVENFPSSVAVTFGKRMNDGDCYRCAVMVAGTEIGELYKEIGVMAGYSATHGVETIFGLCPNEGGNLGEVKRGILSEAKRVDWDSVDWADVGIDCPIQRQTDTGAIPWMTDAELDRYYSNSASAGDLNRHMSDDGRGQNAYINWKISNRVDGPQWRHLSHTERQRWIEAARDSATKAFQIPPMSEHEIRRSELRKALANTDYADTPSIPESALRRATQALIERSMDAVDAMEDMPAFTRLDPIAVAERNLRAAYTDAHVLLNPSEFDAQTIDGVVKRFSQ